MQCKIKEEMHPEIRTIVIGDPQKIILSPRVEVRRVVKHVPAIVDRHDHPHHHMHHHSHHQEMEPKIQIITKPYNPPPPPRPLSPPQHVHVIKDSRQQQQQQQHHYNPESNGDTYLSDCGPRKYIVSRQINVISTSSGGSDGGNVFRTPIVSSTTTAANASAAAAAASAMMRPPPPPPPPSVKIKTANLNEEPSSSIPDLEFDGTTVLCRVCGDKASGFHYGVHSCEGCKGFFRRSIQQKIQYRPCTKNQQCSILRINRNRCQYCRLKKCISVGMSRDAVRFGRVPKREKARIMAAMAQSSQNRGQQGALAIELDDQPKLLEAVLKAHIKTCEFTGSKVEAMRQRARECPTYSMPTLACPLNPAPELQNEQEFSQRFAHVIRGVIDFAGMIPGFQHLTQDDKFTLLKAGLFDALFVRLICMFDSGINSIICLNGQVMRRDDIQNGANARFLVDSTFSFAERMNSMNLTDAEISLFCAIVLITPDRPGLRNTDLVDRMYRRLKQCLQTVISKNRPERPDFMQELLKLMPDLRTLSTLHTEKLVVFRTEHKELMRQAHQWHNEEEASNSPNWAEVNEEIAKSPMGSVSSTESLEVHQENQYATSSLSQSAPLLAATLSGGCPIRNRASSGSSAEDDIVTAAHLVQNGLTITPVVRSVPARYRKLDSPTDSGIESGNEKHEHKLSSGSSSCSSPRSSLEDQQDDKRHIVEDMPVLKRVLQAPPLYDTNSLMDEAYKPHKKFRAMRQRGSEAEAVEIKHKTSLPEPAAASPPQQSQLHMHLTRPQTSSLIRNHPELLSTLREQPHMTSEQIKRTEVIQNYIMTRDYGHKSPRDSRDSLLVTVNQCPYQRWQNGQSVITRNQQTPSPSSSEHRYFQSPHSTSTSPPGPSPSAIPSPRLLELQVDIADPQQPLNLSKKSPTPPPRTAYNVKLEA